MLAVKVHASICDLIMSLTTASAAFEYYFFHFGYFLVFQQINQVKVVCVCVCVCVCVRACVRSCMRACVRSCMRACVRSCMRACVRSCMRACAFATVCKHPHLFYIPSSHLPLSPLQSSQPLTPLPPIVDALYTHLLDAYLTHFLPYTGTIPPPLTSSPTQGSLPPLTTPPGSNQSGLFSSVSPGSPGTLGLLKTNGIGATPVSRHTIQPGMEDVQTETIVQVRACVVMGTSSHSQTCLQMVM